MTFGDKTVEYRSIDGLTAPSMQFRAVAAAMGITYEMLTGDLTQVNFSPLRWGILEFRRRCEAIQHGVIVHQLCGPLWRAWMDQAVLVGARQP